MWLTIIFTVVGIIAGMAIEALVIPSIGTLHADYSDAAKDIFRFEIKDFDSLTKNHYVFVKVECTGLSQDKHSLK